MNIPEYVTIEETRRVCRELGIRDWTVMAGTEVTLAEAKLILKEVNVQQMPIDPENFRQGLEVELEHGTQFADANVTNNHPILTGRIVLAHLKETLDYYLRLDVAELEGDLLKAIRAKDLSKIEAKYVRLMKAEFMLHHTITEQFE